MTWQNAILELAAILRAGRDPERDADLLARLDALEDRIESETPLPAPLDRPTA